MFVYKKENEEKSCSKNILNWLARKRSMLKWYYNEIIR